MSKIRNILDQINKCLQDSTIAKTKIFLNKDKGFWDQLWASLDCIEDTEIAIESFNKLSPEDFQKSSYIHAYGLLQALYLQQDAVSHLKEATIGREIDWKKEYPSVFLVRTIRNESIGHPTKNYNNKYYEIDRSSLSKKGFSYSVWSVGKVNRQNVQFEELIQNQAESLTKELDKILKQIQKNEMEHKKKFKDKSLTSLMPEGELYSFSLLRNLAFRPLDHLAWMVFDKYEGKYKEIKLEIEARYGPIKSTLKAPGTEMLVDELDRIFLRISELKGSDKNLRIDLSIWSDALVDRLEQLKTHLTEIDEEFKDE